MELYSICCNAEPIIDIYYQGQGRTLGDCSECKEKAVFSNVYQMSDEEQEAFEGHCRDLYFYCPLCENSHKKTKTKDGKYTTVWWCQMPV